MGAMHAWMHGLCLGRTERPLPRPGHHRVRIVAEDFSSSPGVVRIALGTRVNLVMVNEGDLLHDIPIRPRVPPPSGGGGYRVRLAHRGRVGELRVLLLRSRASGGRHVGHANRHVTKRMLPHAPPMVFRERGASRSSPAGTTPPVPPSVGLRRGLHPLDRRGGPVAGAQQPQEPPFVLDQSQTE
jgi:hypothetical protein